MATMPRDPHAASELSAGLALQAARYDDTLYAGSYQGVTPSVGWLRGWIGASATISLYHLDENGLSRYGLGDAMLAVHATLVVRDDLLAGAALHAMLPAGGELDIFGMGHVMAMPSVWASVRARPWTLTASAGYGRAVTGLAGGAHVHGAVPNYGIVFSAPSCQGISHQRSRGHRGGRS